MAFDASTLKNPVDPEAVQTSFLDCDHRHFTARSAPNRCLQLPDKVQQPGRIACLTVRFDNFSPLQGSKLVTNQVERLSSRDRKMAPSVVWIASAAHWGVSLFMNMTPASFS